MGDSLKIPYAIRKVDGKMIHISEINSDLRGLKCNCICPDEKCGIDLLARIGTGKRKPHFSHRGGGCNGNGLESGVHKYAKKIISESSYIVLPKIAHKNIQLSDSRKIEIDHVDLEKDVGGFRPDAIIWTIPGTKPAYIEIYYRHKVDVIKINKIVTNNVDTIEIDITDAPIDSPEEFRKYIIDNVESKQWLFCSLELPLFQEFEQNRLLEIANREKEIEISKLKEILSHPQEPHVSCPTCGKKMERIWSIVGQDTNECVINDNQGVKGCGYIEWPINWREEYGKKIHQDEQIKKSKEILIQRQNERNQIKTYEDSIKNIEQVISESANLLSNPIGIEIVDLPFSSCPRCRTFGMQRVRIGYKTYVSRCKYCGYSSKKRPGP